MSQHAVAVCMIESGLQWTLFCPLGSGEAGLTQTTKTLQLLALQHLHAETSKI